MCLDWTNLELAGEDPAVKRKNLDVMLLPCNMKESLLSSSTDKIPDDCNYDQGELLKYLGPI